MLFALPSRSLSLRRLQLTGVTLICTLAGGCADGADPGVIPEPNAPAASGGAQATPPLVGGSSATGGAPVGTGSGPAAGGVAMLGTGGATAAAGGTAGGATAAGGSGGTGGATMSGGAAGAPGAQPQVDCSKLLPAPLTLEADFTSGLANSEDIAFDGKGNMTASRGDEVVLVSAKGAVTVLSADGIPGLKTGRRFMSNGDLVVAHESGALFIVSPLGEVRDLTLDLGFPNGVHIDSLDNVWVTESRSGKLTKVTAAGVVSPVADVSGPNGIFLDEKRGWLYYHNGGGDILRLQVVAGMRMGEPQPVTSIMNAKLDGFEMDACGNLYVVRVDNKTLYRVRLDAAGAAIAPPEVLFTVAGGLTNAQFGRGPGFDELSIYGTAFNGVISRAVVGVPGYRLKIQE